MQAWSRKLVSEHELSVNHLIWPAFVHELDKPVDIPSMPGVQRHSLDSLRKQLDEVLALAIPAIAIFPVVDSNAKTADGAEAVNPDNLVCRTVRAIKSSHPDIGVICDVALDPYTTHGHDGLFENDVVLNDATVEVLTRQAVIQAQAGCDVIAPSDMMDGRIGVIRDALNQHHLHDVRILSYAAKYASAFYGPFRSALGSKSNLGKSDKRSYQMDPAQSDEALREVALDLAEGADMVMVKPGMPYLDIIRRVKETFAVPTFAYQVSGEYAMLKAAAERGFLAYDAVMLESLLAFCRAGADAVVTYAALDAARLIRNP